MVYKSQCGKIDPYDWFCGPGHILHSIQLKGIDLLLYVVWCWHLTLLWQLLVFGLLVHLLTPGLHALGLRLQKLLEAAPVPEARRAPGLLHGPVHAPGLQRRVGRREGGRVQRRVQLLLQRGFVNAAAVQTLVGRLVLRGFTVRLLLRFDLRRLLSRRHASEATESRHREKRPVTDSGQHSNYALPLVYESIIENQSNHLKVHGNIQTLMIKLFVHPCGNGFFTP